MLNQYLQTTQLLLKDTKMERYNLFDLQTYVNVGRGQVAGEGECVRVLAAIPTVISQQVYPFSGISVSGSPGVGSVLSVRMITGSGALLTPREWEWFNSYYVASPTSGTPAEWCQYAQGALGSVLLNPIPSAAISLQADTVCLPLALSSDASPEAIPYPWTDAVPYYAAYMALLTAQQAEAAANLLAIYELFMRRARSQSAPTVLPQQYEGGMGARMAGMQSPISPVLPQQQNRGAG